MGKCYNINGSFASFMSAPNTEKAAEVPFRSGAGQANFLMHRYKVAMLEEGKSPATVNRRLAAVRSLVKMARMIGLVNWSVEIKNERNARYRNTQGPGREVIRKLFAHVKSKKEPKATRAGRCRVQG